MGRTRWLCGCLAASLVAAGSMAPLAAASGKRPSRPKRPISVALTVEGAVGSEVVVVRNTGSACLSYNVHVSLTVGPNGTEGGGTGDNVSVGHAVRASIPAKFAGSIGELRIYRCGDRSESDPLTLPDIFVFWPGYGAEITVSHDQPAKTGTPAAGPCVPPNITAGETLGQATQTLLAAGCPVSPSYQPVLTTAQRQAGLEFTLGGYAERQSVSPPPGVFVTGPLLSVPPGPETYARNGAVYLVNELTSGTFG
jgi:hypothetical protein